MIHRGLFAVAVFMAIPSLGNAHVVLLSPAPRTDQSLKRGPCGGIQRTGEPLEIEAGSELEVRWVETVEHPGFFRLLFSHANDQGFVVLLDNIPDKKVPAGQGSIAYAASVTLPGEPCEAGTLQLIQVMLENPQSPQYYFSCADLRLTGPPPPPVRFLRGDSNSDGKVDISDAVHVFAHLFLGDEALACSDAADTNDDGSLDISDGISALSWLFAAGSVPPAPGPTDCGEDPTGDVLGACTEGEGFCAG